MFRRRGLCNHPQHREGTGHGNHAPVRAYRRRGPRHRPGAPRHARGQGAPERRLRRAHASWSIREQSLDAAAGAGGGRAVRQVFPQHNTRFAHAGVSADPLPLQPGSLSRRPPLHSRRRLAHRPFERHAPAQGHGAARRHACRTAAATRSSPTWPPPVARSPPPRRSGIAADGASMSIKAATARES